jgi:hypothetical protein
MACTPELAMTSQMLADIGIKPRRVSSMTPMCATCIHWFKDMAGTWSKPPVWKCGHIKCGSFLEVRQGHEELWCPHYGSTLEHLFGVGG